MHRLAARSAAWRHVWFNFPIKVFSGVAMSLYV
jgi:hypothetical protein